jgi:hypothetical protein
LLLDHAASHGGIFPALGAQFEHIHNPEWRLISGGVLMKSILMIATALMFTTAANAQVMTTTTFGSQPSAFAEPTLRITTGFRTATAPAEGQTIADPKSQESARQILYRMAEAECATLSEIYKADCRLASVSVSTLPALPNSGPPNGMGASAVYELKTKR